MTHEQFEREKLYRAAIAIAKSMLRQGIINEDDFHKIDTLMLERFRPILAGLYPQNDLIQSEVRGNM